MTETQAPFQIQLASAARVDLSSRKAVRNVLAKRQDWQNQAIDDVRAIGELAYGLTVPSSLIGRTTFFPAMLPDEIDAEPVRLDKNEVGEFIIKQFDRLGNQLSRTDLQFDLAFNILAVGEAYLVCFGERPAEARTDTPATPEHWEVRSITEVTRAGKTIKTWDQLRDQEVILDESKGDSFIRIWRPDPFQHDKAWSNVRAILTPSEELLWWDSAAQAAAKSRLALSGLVGFPDDLQVKPNTDEEKKMSGSELFVKRFIEACTTAIRNPNDAAASVPIAFTYPRNERNTSGVDKIEWERPQDELLEQRTDRSLQRMEQGINLPRGVISGLGEATHWGGGTIEESLFRDHVEPAVILICSALTRAFLLPILIEADIPDPEQYFIWYDASHLIVHRDRAANALRSVELGGISWRAARRELGYSETDKPTPEERAEILEWLQAVRGRAKEAPVENPTDAIETPESPTTPPQQNAPGKRTPEGERSGPMRGRGQDPVAAAVATLCDEQIRRALERAGNRLRNRAKKNPNYSAAINGLPPSQVAAVLGRQAVAILGADDLFDDAFTDLHSRILALLPVDFVSYDTIGPINSLTSSLRIICAESLFSPPSPGPIVPDSLIQEMISACTTESESLSISPVSA